MEEKKSFLQKVFSSVAGRMEEEKAVEQLSDVEKAEDIMDTPTTEGKPAETKPGSSEAIPEVEVKDELSEKSETEDSSRKTPAELSANPKNETIINVLKTIEDPEINMDIWTLELIYDITFKEEGVEILMTFTSPMCPFGPQLMQSVKDKIEEKGIKPVEVKITFSPAWKPSEDVREMLGV